MRGDEARKHCPEMQLVQVPTSHGKADLTIYRDSGLKVSDLLALPVAFPLSWPESQAAVHAMPRCGFSVCSPDSTGSLQQCQLKDTQQLLACWPQTFPVQAFIKPSIREWHLHQGSS